MKATVQPSFLIKNINPAEIYERYKQGYFNRDIPIKNKLNSLSTPKQLLPTHFCHPDKSSNPLVTFVCSNAQTSEKYIKTKENIEGGRCDYCKLDFDGECIGYPIDYDYHQSIEGDAYKIEHLFWVESRCCSYECCLKYLRMIIKNLLINQIEPLLHLMYKLEFNTQDNIKEANDYRLLKFHGGPLSVEEWKNREIAYKRTNMVKKIPIQVIYSKQND